MSSVRIKLSDHRKRIEDRFELFSKLAEELLASGLFGRGDSQEVELIDEALLCATEAYFLVSEAYKQSRLRPGSATQPPKIAALTALVFADFKPLRIKAPDRPLRIPISVYANEFFSLYWAATVYDQDFATLFGTRLTPDAIIRYFRALCSTELNCLKGYKIDAEKGEPRDAYEILIEDSTPGQRSPLSDMPLIDTMMLIFELMWDTRPGEPGAAL